MHFYTFVKAVAFLCINLASVVTTMAVARSPLDTSIYYRLTNDFTGPTKALDVRNDGQGRLQMADLGNYSGQFWHLTVLAPGKYALSTKFLGDNQALDVINDAGTESRSLHLTEKGNYSGQFWTLTPWGDGSYRLTNDFTGPNWHLDVYSNTQEAFLGDGDHSGQHWHLAAEVPTGDGMHFYPSLKAVAILYINLGTVVTTIAVARSPIDTSIYYRLTNDFTGPTKALDVRNDGQGRLQMADLGNYSGQFWHLTVLAPGKYALSTKFLGDNQALDVINDAGTESRSLHLTEKGNYSGQFWTLTPWGDGSYRLTNDFTGPNWHLDVYSNTQEAFLGDGDHSGQHWHLTEIGPVQTP